MKLSYLFLFSLAAAGFIPQTASQAFGQEAAAEAAEPQLGIGSPAPKLEVAGWLQGEPVTAFAADKTYLVEAWATWCGPCIAGIPHLNDLHVKFKDKGFVVIGANVWDGASVEKIGEFVKSREDMTYRIAYDGDKSGPVAKNWLAASGARGIPHAFVVQKGQIIWKGHPARLSEALVASMLDGTYSPEAEAARIKAEETLAEKRNAASKNYGDLLKAKDYEGALAAAETLASFSPEADRKTTLLGLQFRVRMSQQNFAAADKLADEFLRDSTGAARHQALVSHKLPAVLGLKDYDTVIKLADEALKSAPVKVESTEPFRVAKETGWAAPFFQYKLRAIHAKFGEAAALAEMKKFVEQAGTDADVLRMAASELFRGDLFGNSRDPKLAEKWARESLATKKSIAAHLTLAGIYYEKGDKAAGAAEGKLAEALVPDQLKPILQAQLKRLAEEASGKE